ncbi:NACHT, LRR and PYD domains-containing protein 1 isoform X4 [Artibeus jamaicensis]|uniref:NACHT, LRR and PYD domains-containing protein 1 isoform X4 n=1 Tax=Artibeus jamaicensis TaxID=9417 RepID=UPI00235A9A18|nr:NACHT, LRR and PYD domains-containing protein 1 isoform X4 [Artibeus jamaicensis]
MNVPKALPAWTKKSSGADRADASDKLKGTEMASSIQQQLAQNLELLRKDQLKEFQQLLPEQDLCKQSPGVTTAQPEKVDSMEVASHLVAQYGEQQAWDLALQTWKLMGLSELCARVQKEAALESGITEEYYKESRKMPCHTRSWRNEDFQQKFTQLLLLRRSKPRGYHFPLWKRKQESTDYQKHFIEIGDLFGPSPGTQEEPLTVVLHGVAGIGKSTLARQVRRAWEEGRLYRDRFQHVFYFNCRDLAQSRTMSLGELISKDWAGPAAPIEQILSQHKKLLFILDNLDEPKWALKQHSSELSLHWSQQQEVHTLLGSLLKKTLLPGASLLITARITALGKLIPSLQQPHWVEVLGFSESARRDYFYTYFTDESQAVRAFSSVESNPALLTMCVMPLVSWLVCTCLKQQMDQGQELSLTCQTTTILCLHYFFHILQAQSLGIKLSGFYSLAAKGTRQGKTLFSHEDLREHGLDEDIIFTLLKRGVLQEHPTSMNYSFIHLCFQEFFAAMYCVLGDKKLISIRSMKDLIREYGMVGVFGEPTTCFLFGLLSEQGMREMESIFKCQLSPEKHHKLLQLAKKEIDLTQQNLEPYCWHSLHSFYEFQDESFLTAISDFCGMRICVQTDMELLVFSFCIKFSQLVKRLQLNEGESQRQTQRPSGVILSSWGPFTDAWWQIFFSILKVPGSLKDLDLRGNFLSYSAVQSLCEALKCPHCHLETLRLAECGLTAVGCQELAGGLSTNRSLTELDLSFNEILDIGARHLFQSLRVSTSKLQHLLLIRCGLTFACCQDLAFMLTDSPSLTELDLRQNNLGDLGIRLLCKGLGQPTCQLRLLRLADCGLTAKNCQELACELSTNRNLTNLDLSFNKLLDIGAQYLFKRLRVSTCKLQRLLLIRCGLTSACCQDLASMLTDSPSLTDLDLRQNNLGDLGMRLLCKGLGQPTCQLRLLWLDDCCLTAEVCQDMDSGLSTNRNLTKLDLSFNKLLDTGAQHLFQKLRVSTCKLQQLLLIRCGLTSACCQDLAFMLTDSPSLTELDLRQNNLGDLGMRLLCKGLGQPTCQLRLLRLAECGLTAVGCQELAGGLSTNRSLTELDLSFNEILDIGARHLFQSLRVSASKLQHLLLIRCGLTSACCQDLASMLTDSPSLTELDLRQNNLGDLGIRLLCKGLRQPTCQLRLLRMDETQLSDKVKKMLRDLKQDKPQLEVNLQIGATSGIQRGWRQRQTKAARSQKPVEVLDLDQPKSVLCRSQGTDAASSEISGSMNASLSSKKTLSLSKEAPGKGQMDDDTSPLKWRRSDSGILKGTGLEGDFWGPTRPVAPEVLDNERNLYRVHLPMAGSYRWPYTGLHFVVRRPVTIEIEFCSWKEFMNRIIPQHSWMVAGPLLDIKAEPGAVAAVSLPHFVDVQGKNVDKSWFQVAHMKEEGIVLEEPARVEPHYVVLENPSFSPIGVLLRIIRAVLPIPITSNVLLYYHLQHEDVTFHLYLIPNDCSIHKAIDDEEKIFQFVPLHKPPPLSSLYMGSRYTVSGSEEMEIIPQELELCYRNPGEAQLFSELHVGHLRSKIKLYLKQKEEGTLVWEALVKSGDIRPEATLVPPHHTAQLHFVDRHREQLVARVTSVDEVLDKLHGQVLSDEQYERVRAEPTNPDKMRMLFSFSNSWDRACKDQLLQALKETHPHLIKELQER